MSSTCRNCGGAKTPAFYSEHYCEACTTAVEKSRELALKEGRDPGAAKREVLGGRAATTHQNRPDPRTPMTKADYWTAADPTGSESEQ
jgi:hypothetical protein